MIITQILYFIGIERQPIVARPLDPSAYSLATEAKKYDGCYNAQSN